MRQSGFSLIELMVGLVIGLLAIIIIGETAAVFEGQKRTTTGGGDAQTNGYSALLAMEGDIRMAGSGLIGTNGRFACESGTYRQYNGTSETTPPNDFLPPVRIIHGGANTGGDAVVIVRSDVSYAGTVGSLLASPPSVALPGDNCAVAGGMQAPTTEDISRGDKELFLIVPGPANSSAARCLIVQASAKTNVGSCSPTNNELLLKVGSGSPYNSGASWPSPSGLGANDLVIPLGARPYVRYGVSDDGNGHRRLILADQMAFIGTGYTPDNDFVGDDIVYLAAQYGIDTTCTAGLGSCSSVPDSQTVDKYISANTSNWKESDITPTNAARIKAIRIALVVRNSQYNKEVVSPATITLWTKLNASDDAPPTFAVSALPDGQNYRYRIFETIVPLRNMIWGQL